MNSVQSPELEQVTVEGDVIVGLEVEGVDPVEHHAEALVGDCDWSAARASCCIGPAESPGQKPTVVDAYGAGAIGEGCRAQRPEHIDVDVWTKLYDQSITDE